MVGKQSPWRSQAGSSATLASCVGEVEARGAFVTDSSRLPCYNRSSSRILADTESLSYVGFASRYPSSLAVAQPSSRSHQFGANEDLNSREDGSGSFTGGLLAVSGHSFTAEDAQWTIPAETTPLVLHTTDSPNTCRQAGSTRHVDFWHTRR